MCVSIVVCAVVLGFAPAPEEESEEEQKHDSDPEEDEAVEPPVLMKRPASKGTAKVAKRPSMRPKGKSQAKAKAKTRAKDAKAAKAKATAKRSSKRKAADAEVNAFDTEPDQDQASIVETMGYNEVEKPRERFVKKQAKEAAAKVKAKATLVKQRGRPKKGVTMDAMPEPGGDQAGLDAGLGLVAPPTRHARTKASALAEQEEKSKDMVKQKLETPNADAETGPSSGSSSPSSSTESDSSEEQFSQHIQSMCEPVQDDGDGTCPSGASHSSIHPEQVRTREEMFGFAERHLQRLQTYFGADSRVRLSDNMAKMSIMSLYSGLVGAEISAGLIHTALKTMKDKSAVLGQISDFAEGAPQMELACDYNVDCQKVLRSHIVPWWHIGSLDIECSSFFPSEFLWS